MTDGAGGWGAAMARPIFDNASYVAGGPAVIDQVRQRLPAEWRA